ncbi:hypothetical protein NDU88_003697 [Pleurodeles waltl]|uniref:Uncharacterized protein n=1 Tax=Pleurodeles waltl TaxID=8319 RepID=A0AAV7T672_PLEWA|nr:hypothetical protein NDU88_003697 [Pleurodeles waltl]
MSFLSTYAPPPISSFHTLASHLVLCVYLVGTLQLQQWPLTVTTTKKDSNIKDLLIKPSTTEKHDRYWEGSPAPYAQPAVNAAALSDDGVLVTRDILVFYLADIVALKQDMGMDIKDIKRELEFLSQRVVTLGQTNDLKEEELNGHKFEVLELRDHNEKLQYRLEDLEKFIATIQNPHQGSSTTSGRLETRGICPSPV